MRQRTQPHVGIPTRYNGITFRSRLEARWAVFFDLMGWRWEYEPFDANGYIPDFVLLGADSVLVEVKPATSIDETYQPVDRVVEAIRGHWQRDVLFVGVTPLLGELDYGPSGHTHILGLLAEYQSGTRWEGTIEADDWWPGLACWNDCGACDLTTFIHEEQSYRSRICGHYDGDSYVNQLADVREIELRWKHAADVTQWKP